MLAFGNSVNRGGSDQGSEELWVFQTTSDVSSAAQSGQSARGREANALFRRANHIRATASCGAVYAGFRSVPANGNDGAAPPSDATVVRRRNMSGRTMGGISGHQLALIVPDDELRLAFSERKDERDLVAHRVERQERRGTASQDLSQPTVRPYPPQSARSRSNPRLRSPASLCASCSPGLETHGATVKRIEALRTVQLRI